MRQTLERLKIRDSLTGLYSQAYLVELLAHEVRKVRQYGRDLSCLMVDLDDFKLRKEIDGQEVAEATLSEVAALLRESVREADIIARYG